MRFLSARGGKTLAELVDHHGEITTPSKFAVTCL
jgi:hypothetical protein